MTVRYRPAGSSPLQHFQNVESGSFDMIAHQRDGVIGLPCDDGGRDRGMLRRHIAIRPVGLQENPAIAIALVVQHGAKLPQHRHPAGGNQLGVKFAMARSHASCSSGDRLCRLGRVQAVQRRQDLAFPGEIATLDGFAQRHALEFDAQPDDFPEDCRGETRCYPAAALILDPHQPLAFQGGTTLRATG